MFPRELQTASEHLRWLLDRSYPRNAAIKLVGDRHRIDRSGRQILFRGVASRSDAVRRRNRIIGPGRAEGPESGRIGIDGHNVALTVAKLYHRSSGFRIGRRADQGYRFTPWTPS